MKKSLCAVVIYAIVSFAARPGLSQAAREATIEPETKARIILQTNLSSKLNEAGDAVTAVLEEPIYVNGMLVMPRGTEFLGRITEVKPAGRGLKSARMTILFDRVAMPWGEEQVSIAFSSIDDWDKNEKLKADDEGKVKGGKSGRKTAENVALGGTIGGAGAGVIVLAGGAGRGAATAGAAGLGAGILAGLFLTKGNEVLVSPGAIFRIKFVKPLTLPVIQQGGASPRPIQQGEPKEPPGQVKNF